MVRNLLVVLAALLSASTFHIAHAQNDGGTQKRHLVWTEDFNGNRLDKKSWTRVRKGHPDWSNTMSNKQDLLTFEDGCLLLKGRLDKKVRDSLVYVSAGVQSKGKVSFRQARFEVRAKFSCNQGFWPAIWLMPDVPGAWPDLGEIDIMEHLNSESRVFQTVHSKYTYTLGHKDNPKNSGTAPVNPNEFNVYAVEINTDRVDFYVNDVKTHSYPKVEGVEWQFPFADVPYYLILSNQIGGKWVGPVDLGENGCTKLWIDWIKVYTIR